MSQPHPYKNAFQCYKYKEDMACLCPAWLEVIQQAAGDQPATQVKGCFFQLFPWLISGAIRQNNIATMEATAVRQDVQSLGAEVGELRSQVSEQLQGVTARVWSLGSLMGSAGLFGPPPGALSNSNRLRVEIPSTRLIDGAGVEQVAGEVTTEGD